MRYFLKHARTSLSLALISYLLASHPVRASSQPDWLIHPSPEDATYRYYIGRASRAASEAEGFKSALQEAYESAIRENFGFRTKIQTTTYADITKAESTKRVEEISRPVELHGFEELETYHEENEAHEFNVWVLCRYQKAAIQKESKRLALSKDLPEGSALPPDSNDDNSNPLPRGTLEISTTPEGAEIYIDEGHWGATPIRLVGGLLPGQHVLRLDHPRFQALQEKVILRAGGKIHIQRVLIPTTGKVKVTSDPYGAVVKINGKPYGSTPTSELTFPAGARIIVEVSHPNSERSLQEVEVVKDVTRDLDLKLILKYGTLPAKTESRSIASESQAPHEIPQWLKNRQNYNDWVMGYWLGYHDKTLASSLGTEYASLGFSLERQIYGLLGLKGQINWDGSLGSSSGSSTNSTQSTYSSTPAPAVYQLSGWSLWGALPVYLIHTDNEAFYVQVYGGTFHHTYSTDPYGQETYSSRTGKYTYTPPYPTLKTNQNIYGFSAGYQGFGKGSVFGWSVEGGTAEVDNAGKNEETSSFYINLGLITRF